MGQLATGLLSLSGRTALALPFILPALEAPAFLDEPASTGSCDPS